MALAQKLLIRQSQSLVMTPQLSQSIRLLAMSAVELDTFVAGEVERNPFIERAGEDGSAFEGASQDGGESPLSETIGADLPTSTAELAGDLGTSVENAFPDDPSYHDSRVAQATKTHDDMRERAQRLPAASGHEPIDIDIAERASPAIGLTEHLEAQLILAVMSPERAFIAREIIAGLDDNGYWLETSDELAGRLQTSESEIEAALRLVQSLEPVGVGARDLRECLALQLAAQNRLDPAMQTLLDRLDLLAQRDFSALKKLSGLDVADLHDALCEIQALDPRPGRRFDVAQMRPIAPDVIVTPTERGDWRVELNNDNLPRILVDETYAATVSGKGTKDDCTFVDNCIADAAWLTRSLDQRARTILKVAREIVRQQDGFLMKGVQHLRPLTLREVAEAIDMHESSVSRVTSNKFMMTPRGFFELKYFFTSAIAGKDETDSHSSMAVSDRIRCLVNAEEADCVLSDDAIVTALQADGIDIARRTVAKYRDQMNIPSSVQRRREKRLLSRLANSASQPVGSAKVMR